MIKRVAVIVRASEPARVAEALRAALGLSLRGDRIEVVLCDAAVPATGSEPASEPASATASQHAAIERALCTLAQLGHSVVRGDAHIADALRRAHAVEVWT